MPSDSSSHPPAYQVRIPDPEMQKYLQQYPFATGPDAARNRAARAAIKSGLTVGPSGPPVMPIQLRDEENRLPTDAIGWLRMAFRTLGMAEAQQAGLIDDFGWEANLVPRAASRVLVIGCGDGTELLFLRAMLRGASILALDYRDSVTPERKRLIGMEFIGGDMHRHLETLRPEFDLVYSNHTLEHMYAPEQTLATLCGLLVSGGSFVSALPMDANPGSPFLNRIAELAAADRIHPIDYVYLDAGHPWKTHPANLEATFRSAGFSQISLYQRATHPGRVTGHYGKKLQSRQRFSIAGNRLLFGPPRAALKAIFPGDIPDKLVKLLLAVERRTPFGTNIIKTRYTQEVLVSAIKE